MKGRCCTCKYWSRDEAIAKMGKCSHPKFVDGTSGGVTDLPSDGLLVIEQYEGLYPDAFLRVGQDFGCIHWSDRDAT